MDLWKTIWKIDRPFSQNGDSRVKFKISKVNGIGKCIRYTYILYDFEIFNYMSKNREA